MTDFLNAVKADLLDRRLLPFLALVGVGLAAALAYAVLGGSTSATPSATGGSTSASTGSKGIAVTQAPPNPDQPVAETTSGSAVQHRGQARNPFAPLAGTATAKASGSAVSSKGSGTSTTSSTGSSGAGSSGESAPVAPSKPAKPTKPATVYHVAVLFGVVPLGAAPKTAQLTPYENLKLLTPLPTATQPLVVFRGVTVGGKSATFTVVGEAILRGEAACLPSASQCQEIDLKPGQFEELEYLTSAGQTVVEELRVVGITSTKASSAGVKSFLRGTSKAGRELLRQAGLVAVPGLRYSSQAGVLVFAGRHAFAARAHAARDDRNR